MISDSDLTGGETAVVGGVRRCWTVNEEGVRGKALALPQSPFQGIDLDID